MYGYSYGRVDLNELCDKWDKGYSNAGSRFERNVYTEMRKYMLVNQHLDDVQGYNTDKMEGTDMIFRKDIPKKDGTTRVMSIRLDPTLNFNQKDHMPYVRDTNIRIAGFSLKMGVRYGNSHKSKHNGKNVNYTAFPEPVAVFGFDMDPKDYDRNEAQIIKELGKKTQEIMEMARQMLNDFTLTDTDKRLKVKQRDKLDVLHKNRNYKEPRVKVEDRWSKILELRQTNGIDNRKYLFKDTQADDI